MALMPIPPPIHPPAGPGPHGPFGLPFTPHDAAVDTAAALNFGTALLKLVASARENGGVKFGAREAILQIALAALAVSNAQVHALKALRQELETSGVDIKTKSADQIVADVSWWRRRRYRAIKAYNTDIRAITDKFSDLYSELIAIAHCRETEDAVVTSQGQASADMQRRDGLLRSDKPLGMVLDELISDAENLRAQIEAAGK